MSSRMEKYHNKNEKPLESRTKRNKKLYQEINNNEIQGYDINSNVSVLDVPGNEIDVEKIKEILEKRYKNPIKRKSIQIDDHEEVEEVPYETKDYDLSKILEKARESQQIDYSKERLKKLRDTQYDILNKLNLEKPEELEEEVTSEAEKALMTMIETITSKEKKSVQTDTSKELELFSDLQGDDGTIVVPPITEEQKIEYEKTMKQELKENKPLENSFYSGNLKVEAKDFEDFVDLKNEINTNSTTIKILVILFSIIILIGLLFLFDKMFSWGIFMEVIKWK